MKIRNSFVSNSSSTSYVIAIPHNSVPWNRQCKCCGQEIPQIWEKYNPIYGIGEEARKAKIRIQELQRDILIAKGANDPVGPFFDHPYKTNQEIIEKAEAEILSLTQQAEKFKELEEDFLIIHFEVDHFSRERVERVLTKIKDLKIIERVST